MYGLAHMHTPVALGRCGRDPSPERCRLALPLRLLRWLLATTKELMRRAGIQESMYRRRNVMPGRITYRRAATDKSTLVRLYLLGLHAKPIS